MSIQVTRERRQVVITYQPDQASPTTLRRVLFDLIVDQGNRDVALRLDCASALSDDERAVIADAAEWMRDCLGTLVVDETTKSYAHA